MSSKDLIGTRRKLKAKKPEFRKQNTGLKKKLSAGGWRKPKGYHSKLRLRRKSHGAFVSPGYKSPTAVRGLSREGLIMVHVSNTKQLAKLDKSVHGVIIDSAIGMRKRLEVMESAIKAELKILNFRKAQDFVTEQRALFEKRTKEKKEKKKPKKAAQSIDEKVSKDDKASKSEPAADEEEKKKEEKQEKDKLLTKRQ